KKGIMAILASPHFLYRAHTPPEDTQPGEIFTINDLQLASRLSFFLWSQGPDEALLQRALAGQLGTPEALEAEVKRMLADPRARSLVTNFAYQRLHDVGTTPGDPSPART